MRRGYAYHWARSALLPRPSIAKPERRQHVQLRWFRSGIAHADAHAQIPRCRLGVVHGDLPVAVIVEHPRVDQLELGVPLAAPGVLLAQPRIGELRLRIVVTPLQPRGGRRRVGIPPVLLDVLAVIALVAAEAEDALLQERVAAVPEGEREAHALLEVANTRQAVFVPAVGARASVLMREIVPGRAVIAVVLAHRAPGALTEIRAERLPLPGPAGGREGEACVFSGSGRGLRSHCWPVSCCARSKICFFSSSSSLYRASSASSLAS